jgi:beta-lactamase family protein
MLRRVRCRFFPAMGGATLQRTLAAVAICAACSVTPSLAASSSHRPAPGRGWQPHVRAAKRYVATRGGTVSFAVIGLDGVMHRLHGSHTAPMASTFKVMLLATYLRQHSVRHRELNHGDRSLLRPMIERSDNTAATRVRDIVGVSAIEKLARDAGMRDFTYNSVWGLSRTSSRDQARFMLHLERYIPREHRHYAFHLLRNIVPSQSWGIGRVRPRGWKLYFKGGWGSGSGAVDHQVAVLKRHGERVSVAILTENDGTHAYGKQTLRGVAGTLLKGLQHAGRR